MGLHTQEEISGMVNDLINMSRKICKIEESFESIRKALVDLEDAEKLKLEGMLFNGGKNNIDLNWHGGKVNGIRCALDLLNEHIEWPEQKPPGCTAKS